MWDELSPQGGIAGAFSEALQGRHKETFWLIYHTTLDNLVVIFEDIYIATTEGRY